MKGAVVPVNMRDARPEEIAKQRASADTPGLVEPFHFEWADEISQPTIADEILKGMLSANQIAAAVGPSGCGKSTVAVTIADAIGSDAGSCLGLDCVSGTVLYCAPESPDSVKNRLLAVRRRHGRSKQRVAVVGAGIDLRDETRIDADAVIATAAIIKPLLIIIDTVARSYGAGDENSSFDMGRYVEAVDRIRRETGAAVLLIHHQGKDASKGLRGHSSLLAALDVVIEISNDDGRVMLRLAKHRDAAVGTEIIGRLVPIEIGTNGWGEPLTACVLELEQGRPPAVKVTKLPKGAEIAFRALREAISEFGETLPATSTIPPGMRAVTGDTWRRRYYALDAIDLDSEDPKAAGRAADMRKKRFTRARIALQESAAIGAWNNHYWIGER